VSLLEWREEFRIGIPEVDHEHRELIAAINALSGPIDDRSRPESVADFLGELHAQISAHFALEEKVMRARHYAGYQAHKDEHEQLLDRIREIMDQHQVIQRYDPSALRETLNDWFGQHFRTRDAELHAALHRPT